MTGSYSRTFIVVLSLLSGLAGCAGRTYYSEVPEPGSPQAPRQQPQASSAYVVKPGDSLFSIAFAAGTDWRALADLNRIGQPYTIYPGQALTLSQTATGNGMEPDPEAPTAVRTQAAPDAGAPLVVSAVAPVAAMPQPSLPAREPAPVREQQAPASAPASSRALPPPPAKPGGWQWPSVGKMILGFSAGAQPHKGVDMSGSNGDPVVAAKGGTVVYAGNGVRGYGNLLIVKHDALFLSAYAHNSKLMVKEGDTVRGGQQIAEMGDSGTDRTKLHFEIRKQGSPIDPLKILPGR